MLNIRLKVYIYSFVFFGKFLFKAIVKNQMACPHIVVSVHLRGPMPIFMCQWGVLLGDSVPLQWLPND